MKKWLIALLLACIVSIPGASRADCDQGSAFFDMYPGDDNSYPISTGPANYSDTEIYPFNYGAPFGPGTGSMIPGTFAYEPWAVIMTSGVLTQWPNQNYVWTESYNLRFVFRYGGRGRFNATYSLPISWARTRRFYNMTVNGSFWPYTVQSCNGAAGCYPGVVLLGRYITENDYYTASLRMNGDVLLQRQNGLIANGNAQNCPYNPTFRISRRFKRPDGSRIPAGQSLPLSTWYNLQLVVTGTNPVYVGLWINGIEQFDGWRLDYPASGAIPYGTGGVRTDYVTTYIDNTGLN
jgi:hypothetical protein